MLVLEILVSCLNIVKNCKNCKGDSKHRWIKDKTLRKLGYYAYSTCADKASVKHRKKYWLRYLAQKANARKRQGSEKMTEAMLQVVWNRQDGKCALTGLKMNVNYDFYKPSLDRIDSNKGYKEGNIQLVAFCINRLKSNFDEKHFIDMCYQVVNNIELNKYPHTYHIFSQE